MTTDILGIYRARRDPKAAARLAARFAQDQALEKAKAPLFMPMILVWIVIVVCAVLVGLALWGSIGLHGSIGVLGLLPAALGYGLYRLQRGLRQGIERIEALADDYTNRGLNRLLPAEASPGAATSAAQD